ncbi:MAG: hypothetical protein RSF42_18545, partial [Comamonas sp.]
CFAMLAKIPPRSKEEALQVYQHLEDKDGMDRNESSDILRNLVTSGWQTSTHTTAPKRTKKGTLP